MSACDRVARDRSVKGSAHGQAVLTEQIVIECRRLYTDGLTVPEIIERLRITVARGTLHRAISGRRWRHIPNPCHMRPPGPLPADRSVA